MRIASTAASLWLLIILLNSSCKVLSLNKEGSALLFFKRSINEDSESSFTNWNSSDEDPCSWNGITCRERKVISISLPKAGLEGTLSSSSIGSLHHLRHINLRNNRLSGRLHSEFFSAQELQSLVLYGNLLSGSLPPEIGNLSYLQIFDISQNLLNGSIPASLLHCHRLKSLVLSHNNFTNTLPRGFGISFAALEKLDLSFNALSGSIPSDIGNLSNLQGILDFSHNLFSGLIPESLGHLSERVYIDLAYNNLSGPVPKNGALANRGSTAFIGNPGLCGPPLKIPCLPFSPPPAFAPNSSGNNVSYKRRLKGSTLTAIVLSDLAAVCLIAMVLYFCYRRAISSKRKEEERYFGKGLKSSKECLCFRKNEIEKSSENVEKLGLIPLDKQVYFDLDELLKGTAFVLGKNDLGIVYKVVLEDGLTLAVRRLGEGGSQRFKEFQMEVEAIGRIKHPNIVALIAYYWSFEEKLLIYDYIPGGNLSAAIHGEAGAASFSPLPWVARVKIINGIARGLAHLHDFSPKKYIHGDIKPNNILLGLDMEPYISDFGVGRLGSIASGSPMTHLNKIIADKSQNSDSSVSPIIKITSSYQAPEAQKGMKPTQKWDVFSFGVILLELISGRSPVVLLETLRMDLVKWIQFCIEERKPLLDVLDPFLAEEPEKEDEIISVLKVALACVQYSSEKRPSMRNVAESLQSLSILT